MRSSSSTSPSFLSRLSVRYTVARWMLPSLARARWYTCSASRWSAASSSSSARTRRWPVSRSPIDFIRSTRRSSWVGAGFMRSPTGQLRTVCKRIETVPIRSTLVKVLADDDAEDATSAHARDLDAASAEGDLVADPREPAEAREDEAPDRLDRLVEVLVDLRDGPELGDRHRGVEPQLRFGER